MRRGLLFVMFYLTFFSLFAQDWNSNGDNYTTGKVDANNLLINRGIISESTIDSRRNIGFYRVHCNGFSDALIDISGFGGSTPRLQFRARYDDRLFFRAARDNDVNWDNKSFQEIITNGFNGVIQFGTNESKAKLNVGDPGMYSPRITVRSNINDRVNDSPWYGLGYSSYNGLSDTKTVGSVQLAGYYGLLMKTSQATFAMCQNGNIGIGTTNPKAKLHVDGNILATEIKVQSTGGADFVFEDDYQLKDLSEVEQFIATNKHLPDIPSAKQMEENGVSLAEMNKLLLQKVEELMLYTIEQEKKLMNKNKELEELKKRMSKIESFILK